MYPLKFQPIVKDKIWGGHKLQEIFGKQPDGLPNIGESWELSGYPTDASVVANGYLAGKTLPELIEKYRGQLVGERVYNRFGNKFPLLFKLIDANDDLSIQVHPNDDTAGKRHQSFGKTEMWYVLHAEPEASLIIGFTKKCTKKQYLEALEKGEVETLLQKVPVQAGDVFFIPAGLVHAIGRGVMVAEIQESSDVTYRIYDYKRTDDKGNERELHTAEALDVINFSASKNPKTPYRLTTNADPQLLVSCEYFTTNIMELDKPRRMQNVPDGTFVVYMCLEGSMEISGGTSNVQVKKGETVLIPAGMDVATFIPEGKVRLMEIYIR
ncbi:MAG TPA: mannose-6-phosphate isomerase [Paludibacteraceae bacterium]|nr:mannose-6-phosphate isomerase [Paludibacteraceae bacterium]